MQVQVRTDGAPWRFFDDGRTGSGERRRWNRREVALAPAFSAGVVILNILPLLLSLRVLKLTDIFAGIGWPEDALTSTFCRSGKDAS